MSAISADEYEYARNAPNLQRWIESVTRAAVLLNTENVRKGAIRYQKKDNLHMTFDIAYNLHMTFDIAKKIFQATAPISPPSQCFDLMCSFESVYKWTNIVTKTKGNYAEIVQGYDGGRTYKQKDILYKVQKTRKERKEKKRKRTWTVHKQWSDRLSNVWHLQSNHFRNAKLLHMKTVLHMKRLNQTESPIFGILCVLCFQR